jgi:hypothetical protein
VRAFLLLRVPPAQVIDLIQALVDERQLSRRRASGLEEKVLGKVEASRGWK